MPFLPILCYHHVGVSGRSEGHPDLWLSREQFAAQMAYLSEKGYRCLSLRNASNYLIGDAEVPFPAVVLTFDDGYRDFHQGAYPILRHYGFGATVFVVTQAVGGLSRWAGNPEFALMNWEEITELHREGVEFGSHSTSHPRLTRVPLRVVEDELRQSRRILEDRLATAVHSFAYPYGAWNSSVEKLVEETGYGLACSMLPGNLHARRQRFRLKRIAVAESISVPQYAKRLSPLYDYTSRLRRWLRPVRRLRKWLS